LDGLFAVLDVPDHGLAYAGERRQLRLGQCCLFAMAFDELWQRSHYWFSGNKLHQWSISRREMRILQENTFLAVIIDVFY
jgi:hypothetical protein